MREVQPPDFDVPVRSRLGRAIDWGIMQVAPGVGARRIMQRDMLPKLARHMADRAQRLHELSSKRGGWDGARDDGARYRDWKTSKLPPDAEAEAQQREAAWRCIDLYKNEPVAHGAVESRVTNEVGVGIRPQSRVKSITTNFDDKQAEEFNRTQEQIFSEWSEDGCDRQNEKSMPSCQRTLVRMFANCGEAFVEFQNDVTRNGPLPLVFNTISPFRVETPPERSADPLCRMGVQYDRRKQVDGYWVREQEEHDTHVYTANPKDEYRYVKRRDKNGYVRMSHIYEKTFDAQSRGFPWFAANLNRLRDMSQYTEAAIVAAQTEACLAVFIRSATGMPQTEAENAASRILGDGKRIEEIYPGMIEYLGQDDEITINPSTRPSGTFAPFMEWGLRTIASGIDFPYELLHKNFFRTTYASGRLAMLDGRMGFLCRRSVVVDDCLKPLWKLMTLLNVQLGNVRTIDLTDFYERRWAYNTHCWLGSGWQSIDPEREIKASKTATDSNHGTFSESLGERGIEFYDHAATKLEEDIVFEENRVKVAAARKKKMAELDVAIDELLIDEGLAPGNDPKPGEQGNPQPKSRQSATSGAN